MLPVDREDLSTWRRARTKYIDLRRILQMLLLLLCASIAAYFFWQQTVSSSLSSDDTKEVVAVNPYSTQCVHQCGRRAQNHTSTTMSLKTCTMLCGSADFWPQPTGHVELGNDTVSFTLNQIRFGTSALDPARTLLKRCYRNFNESVSTLVKQPHNAPNKTDIGEFLIEVHVSSSDHDRLKLDTDESYNLTVRLHDARLVAFLEADNYFGVRHGLETLLQLIWWDEDEEGGGLLRTLDRASVADAPTFAYRGLMIDTARNYIPVEGIKRVLVGMAANKLNVLHWHATDSQSFPLVLPSAPILAQYGAYGKDMVYKPRDVKALVDFALVRGIRIILEVDTPAHVGDAWAWGPDEGLGNLVLCLNEHPWSLYCRQPPCGQLNPDNPHVYNVLENVYKDLIDLSGETELFHLGGDDVNQSCWDLLTNKSGKKGDYIDIRDIWGGFTVKAMDRLQNANEGKRFPNMIFWSGNLSKRPWLAKYLDKDNVVVQVWGDSSWEEAKALIADQYKVILSHVDAWHLDCGFGTWRETGGGTCDPYRPWYTVYFHRPWDQQRLNTDFILGGEVCLWSEQESQSSVDGRLWPRAAAFAERVWSDPSQVDTLLFREDVYRRLNTQRERLASRGLAPEAFWPMWCTQNPGMCL